MNNFYRYPHYNNLNNRQNNIQNIPFNRNSPPPKPTPPPKKKIDFKCLKNNTCKSLNDVEHFLCDFSSFMKYIKLYCLLKK